MFGHRYPSIATVKKLVDEVERKTSTKPPRIITLIGCQEDETPVDAAGYNTTTADLTNFKVGDRGWKIDVASNAGYQVDFNPASPLAFPPCSAIGAWVFVEDATKLTTFKVNIYNDKSDLTYISSYDSTKLPALVNGWNLLRYSIIQVSYPPNLEKIYRIRIQGNTSAATSLTVGHIWLEYSEKAQLLFIQDGATSVFYNVGYPDLKKRGIPVTWALSPAKLGTTNYITKAQADQLAIENNNSMSFHSWDAEVSGSMTAAQLRTQTMKTLKWLRTQGYSGGIWRAAFMQNLATNHAAIQGLVMAYRRPTGTGTMTPTCFPFPTTLIGNRYDVPFVSVHGYNDNAAGLEAHFANLEKYHGLMVCYTHNIGTVNAIDTTPTRWAHFLSLIDTGVTEGWLECVTMEQLMARSGIKHKQGLSDWVTEYYNDGEAKTIRLP